VCVQQERHIAHKFESGWDVGVIKAFDKKGPHAGKFSVKYKDDPNWWTQSLLREGYGKDKLWVLPRLPSRDSLEVTMTVSAGSPIFWFVPLLKSLIDCSEVC
jgi:hypothetical protein